MQQPGPPPPGGYNPMMQPGPPPPGEYNPNNMQPGMQRPPTNFMGAPPSGNMGPPKPGPGMNPAGMNRLPVSGASRPQYPGQMIGGQTGIQRTGQAPMSGYPPPTSSSNQYGVKPVPGVGPPPLGQMPVSTGQQSNYRTGPPTTSSSYPTGPPPPNGVGGPPMGPLSSGHPSLGPPTSRFSTNAHNRFSPSGGATTNSFANGSSGPPPPTSNFPTQRIPNSGPPPSGTPPIGGALPLPVAQVPPTIQQDRPSSTGDQNASLNSSGPPSARSSAAPSPIPTQQYDNLEGGLPFFPNSQGAAPPPAGDFATSGQYPQQPNTYTGPPPHAGGQYLGPPPPGGRSPHLTGAQPIGPPPTGAPPMGQNYMSGPPTGPPTGPPPTGPPTGPPMGPPTGPPMGPPTGPPPPTGQDLSRTSGIVGKRQYPQQPGYMTSVPPQSGSGMTQPPTSAAQQPGSYHPSQMGGQCGPASQVLNDVMRKDSTTMNDINAGMNNIRLQETRPINLLQERHILPSKEFEPPKPKLHPDYQKIQVSPDVFRSTLNSIPESQSLLQKSRLPLGLIIHPFRDLSHLPVIQSSVIVRCRSCRTYINPFVAFIDQRRWRCNLCFRVNDLPEEFTFDPVTKTYGDPQRRPEIKSATIEFIAPSEYMLRPPQPAVYLFLLDVSFSAVESGYLSVVCQGILDNMEKMPGDARTMMGFITYDSMLHFYSLPEGATRPQMMVVSDIDDVFLPCPSDLLVNVQESKELICELLNQLPAMFVGNKNTQTALGPALQAAHKLMSPTGGRVTIFQCSLPSVGVGALKAREDPNQRATAKSVPNIGPATDFYKKMALDFSGQQIAADIFMLGAQYMDIATLAGIAKFSGGCLNYYPAFHTVQNPIQAERLESDLKRYLTRKIGFEAVMRIRCTKGMSIHTFHGNFFVRSTDLLSLPNINPDSGFAMQVAIEDNLNSSSLACFQAALLYTSSKGERRIRVHTMCLPVTNQLTDVMVGADAQAISGLLARMAVDKCQTSSLGDARDALVNVCLDSLAAYKTTLASSHTMGALMSPPNLRLLPIYTLALLKNLAFRIGMSTKLDTRVFAMEMFKCMPLLYTMLHVHPDLYAVHNLTDEGALLVHDQAIPQPGLVGLSSEYLSRDGAFLMDCGDIMYLFVGQNISQEFCRDVLDAPNFVSIPEGQIDLPELDNPKSEQLRLFVNWLLEKRPYHAPLLVIRDDSRDRGLFLGHLIQDRSEGSMSYYEFIQHLQKEIK